jgi:exodeoxyribonuclease VII large subunit
MTSPFRFSVFFLHVAQASSGPTMESVMTAHTFPFEAPVYGGGADAALTVSQLSQHLRGMVAQDDIASDVWVRGELSSVTRASSGHLYFALKDSESCVECVMWRSSAQWLRFELEPGNFLLVHGHVDLYPARSRYQLVIDQVEPEGQGALFLAFEQLRARLQAEGLFDPTRKRPLPFLPGRVAVITSASGAAVHDICTVIRRRCTATSILVLPAAVQGGEAPESLCRALALANLAPEIEVIIIGRGGGSAEDLWCFNDERVVRAIAGSKRPIISAVGHETDFTLADFAADERAPTPSAAAERVVPDLAELSLRVQAARERLAHALRRRVAEQRDRLQFLNQRPCLARPGEIIDLRRQRVDDLDASLSRAMTDRLSDGRTRIAILSGRLDALSPLKVMGRGYAAVEKLPERRLVRAATEARPGDKIAIRFHDGTLITQVERVERPHEEETE